MTYGIGHASATRGARPAGKTATTGTLVHQRVASARSHRGSAMPRDAIPFATPDLSAFARSLGRALAERTDAKPPGHVELLNLIARAAGHRNLQALRASLTAPVAPLADEDRALPLPLSDNARKALKLFDTRDRLVRWPTKFSIQKLAMWVLWTRFDSRRVYSEKEVNALLREANAFGDHVTLRRELVDHRLLERKSDCSEYRKLPARPDDETRAMLSAWRARRRSQSVARRSRPAAEPAE
jgi:hypothetical protein